MTNLKAHKGDEDYTTKKGDTLKEKRLKKKKRKAGLRTYGMGSKKFRV